ncbi:MAG: class I SAM-dependent RNA methyltransferase [Anaerolineales bacterium]|nr:class I SAM-dependent RNA methyltransferase [Anaerolineales bacterium]
MNQETRTIRLTGMAYGGEAIGRDSDGRMVFVPFGMENETVQVRLTDVHKRWARAELVSIDQPSPDRQKPRCPHFQICGGCHYQHIPYEQQLIIKQGIVSEQLSRIGLFEQLPVQPIVPSPNAWGTRNKATFAATPDGQLAYHGFLPDELVPIEQCPILQPEMESLRQILELETLEGIDHVTFRTADSGEMIIFEGSLDESLSFTFERPLSVVWIGEKGVSILSGADQLLYVLDGLEFVVSAGSFFQVNTALIPTLVQRVLELLAPRPGQVVIDAYAGAGLFSKFLAEKGVEVLAIEQSPWSCRDFELNLDPYNAVSLYEADVETTLPVLTVKPDSILLDPPRSGLTKEARLEILRLQPDRIVYVSCDPATLARDGRQFAGAGYSLSTITPIDLFPQTYHIESVSLWLHE